MDFLPTAYIGMLNGKVNLVAATVTPIRVGTANMPSRKWLIIQNASTVNIFIGSATDVEALNTAITKDALARCGIKIAKGDTVWLPVSDTITIYGISQSTWARLRVTELG